MIKAQKRSFILAALAIVAALCMGALVAACNKPEPAPTPVKLLLDYSDVKIDYEFDEPFTYSGLKVRAELSDGNVVDVTNGYKVTPPEMTPGQHMVNVTYGELSAKYPIFVDDIVKIYDDTEMFTVNGEGIYTIEAEDINLKKCVAEPYKSDAAFVKRTGSVFVSKNQYLQNIGVSGNSIGWSYNTDTTYDDVCLAVNIGNMTDADISLSNFVAMYFNFAGYDDMGELDISGVMLKAHTWQTLAFTNLALVEHGNFIMEFTDDADVVLDCIKVIVGADNVHSDSEVNIEAGESNSSAALEIEDMNTEKLVTVPSVAAADNLKLGQPKLNNFADGTGKYVSDLKIGTTVSTFVNLENDANVQFKLRANIAENYDIGNNWKFTIDSCELATSSASAEGWSDVELGTYALKAGRHLFTATLVGTACDVDKFDFTATANSDENAVLISDLPEKDFALFSQGVYKAEAEFLVEDRSEWEHSLSTEEKPRTADEMVAAYTEADGATGVCVTKIKSGSKLKISFTLGKKMYVKLNLRVAQWSCKTQLDVTRASTRVIGTATDDDGNVLVDRKLSVFSHDDFVNTATFKFGDAYTNAVLLEPDDYTFVITSGDLSYDWFEVVCFEYEDGKNYSDVNLAAFGTYKVEAEELSDKDGWIHAWATSAPDKVPSDYKEYGQANAILGDWEYNGDGSTGMSITRIKAGSVIKVHFSLGVRANIAFKLRVSKYGHNTTQLAESNAVVKINGDSVAWRSMDDFTKTGTTAKDTPWGLLECEYVTLDPGDYTAEITFDNGNMSFDYFVFDVLDPAYDVVIADNGTYRVEGENLIDRTGWEGSIASGPRAERWTRNDDFGYCVTKIKDGSSFVLRFKLEQRADVTFSAALSKYKRSSTAYDQSWMREVKIGDAALTMTQRADSSFKDEANGSTAYFGIVDSNTVTLDAGVYEITWTSGDVSYDYFDLTVAAPTA